MAGNPATPVITSAGTATGIGMERYATAAQRPQLAKARAAAEKWLAQTPLTTQEDRIWRLWGLHRLKGDAATQASVRQGIMAAQLKDGGWAPADGQPGDAFATGQTLFVLRQTGSPPDDSAVLPRQAHQGGIRASGRVFGAREFLVEGEGREVGQPPEHTRRAVMRGEVRDDSGGARLELGMGTQRLGMEHPAEARAAARIKKLCDRCG